MTIKAGKIACDEMSDECEHPDDSSRPSWPPEKSKISPS